MHRGFPWTEKRVFLRKSPKSGFPKSLKRYA